MAEDPASPSSPARVTSKDATLALLSSPSSPTSRPVSQRRGRLAATNSNGTGASGRPVSTRSARPRRGTSLDTLLQRRLKDKQQAQSARSSLVRTMGDGDAPIAAVAQLREKQARSREGGSKSLRAALERSHRVSPNGETHSGWLIKQKGHQSVMTKLGNVRNRFYDRRFFCLEGTVLRYYKREKDAADPGLALGEFHLESVTAIGTWSGVADFEDLHCMRLYSRHRKGGLLLAAYSEGDFVNWLAALAKRSGKEAAAEREQTSRRESLDLMLTGGPRTSRFEADSPMLAAQGVRKAPDLQGDDGGSGGGGDGDDVTPPKVSNAIDLAPT